MTVRYFASFKEASGTSMEEVELEDGSTISGLFQRLEEGHPGLEELSSTVLFSVNLEVSEADRPLKDGDEVGIFPPVSGG